MKVDGDRLGAAPLLRVNDARRPRRCCNAILQYLRKYARRYSGESIHVISLNTIGTKRNLLRLNRKIETQWGIGASTNYTIRFTRLLTLILPMPKTAIMTWWQPTTRNRSANSCLKIKEKDRAMKETRFFHSYIPVGNSLHAWFFSENDKI